MNNINDYKKLGEILIEQGKINVIQLSMALDIQKFHKMNLGQILLEMKAINSKDLEQALKILQKRNENDI